MESDTKPDETFEKEAKGFDVSGEVWELEWRPKLG